MLMALEWDINEALQARLEDGRDMEKKSIALKLLKKGMDLYQIKEVTDLPIAKIEELADKCKNV